MTVFVGKVGHNDDSFCKIISPVFCFLVGNLPSRTGNSIHQIILNNKGAKIYMIALTSRVRHPFTLILRYVFNNNVHC